MDFLEQPEIKTKYNRCKYIVKLWEHNFKKSKGRLPCKLDIREADIQVRNAYRKYYQLKTQALEQSFKDVEGFNSDEEHESEQPQEVVVQHQTLEDAEPEQLQEVVQHQTLEDPEADGVWGAHLDKQTEETDKNKDIEQAKSNLNLTFSKKLFCGSKFTKRNPRKSLSFTQKLRSEASFESPNFLSQPIVNNSTSSNQGIDNNSLAETNLSFAGLFSDTTKSVKFGAVQSKVQSQSISLVQSILEDSQKPLKNVDAGWLERVGIVTGVDIPAPQIEDNIEDASELNLSYGTDEDIIDNSDDECLNLAPDLKKPRLSQSVMENLGPKLEESVQKSVESGANRVLEGPTIDTSHNNNQDLVEANKISEESDNEENYILSPLTKSQRNKAARRNKTPRRNKSPELIAKNPFEFLEEPWEAHIKKASNAVITKKQKKKKAAKQDKKEEPPTPIRQSSRSSKTNVNFEEFFSEDEDPFHSDNDSNDPEFSFDITKDSRLKKFLMSEEENEDEESTVTQNKKSDENKKTATAKNKINSKKNTNKSDNKETENKDEDSGPYELEYCIKPRVSAPRFKNIKKLIQIETSSADTDDESKENKSKFTNNVKSKRQQDKEKLQKKIASGCLNENFVTIDLKKKIYVRGKKTMTFGKYKKQMWKNKKKALAGPDMDMGGCDGGMLTCFNCGDIGHFARNCTKTKGDRLLPLEAAQEEPCPFPTLEEAALMAKNSVLAIRKPNLGTNCDGDGEKIAEEEEDDDGDLFDDVETEKLLAETLKLEEHVAKLDLQSYMDRSKVVEPYYKLKDDGGLIATPEKVLDTLKQFGHSEFRPGQEQAIMRILSGKSTLVTLSTGSGKSLCYQIPAYLYSQREPSITLVVSPLVSLMEDQVLGIPIFLKAACLHTNQTKTQREKILETISAGNLDILLVSPEAVVAGERSTGFGSLLRKLPPIAFACIDEAHCVSQWSHNFRPSYLMICRVLRERMGVKIILGLTATATRATSDSIIKHLQIPDGRDGIISDIPLPDNLFLTVSKDHQRDNALLALLKSDRFKDCRSIIIYCTRREQCNRLTKFLRTCFQYETSSNSVEGQSNDKKRKRVYAEAEPYHAGLAASKRRTIQKAFMLGELRIVVATVAFGMGINKRNIRAVIHYNMPKSFESYVQEIGRAGRDGLPAHCHLFLDPRGGDENELRRHIHANSVDRHVIRKLLQKIFLPCSCRGTCPRHEVAFSIEQTVKALDIPEENISTLLCYLELHQKNYIELLSPAYTVCKVISYGGPLQIRKAAKECPPLAMALALKKGKNGDGKDENVLEFAVVDIAAAIGWDSGICKHKLKNLEWTTVNGQPKRSTLNVQFSNLGFRLLAPGNLSDDQLDEALDSLYAHVTNQEETSLLQLRAVHQTLTGVVSPTYTSCLSQEPSEGNSKLKVKIREYFDSPNPLDSVSLENARIIDEELIMHTVRSLINMYRDNNFTGRAVARIFHGISSPNYPAVIWGRCKFWRRFIDYDFHAIIRIATKEILNSR